MTGEGIIDDEEVVFKGGSALRKFVFGARGRFSVDLDFTINDRYYGEHILTALQHGLEHDGVRFSIVGDVDMKPLKASWRRLGPPSPPRRRPALPPAPHFSPPSPQPPPFTRPP